MFFVFPHIFLPGVFPVKTRSIPYGASCMQEVTADVLVARVTTEGL
jgi:hypothetical protein